MRTVTTTTNLALSWLEQQASRNNKLLSCTTVKAKTYALYICLGCLIFWVVFIVLVVVLVIVYEVTDDDGRAR